MGILQGQEIVGECVLIDNVHDVSLYTCTWYHVQFEY